ncbi:MAG: hypothetical protein KDA96_21740, partial [Planctomycetaceae bacterium]|nr:hypothetical protein [Planctomycetaceae bacterium]
VPQIDLTWMDEAFRYQVENSGQYLGQAWGESVVGYVGGDLISDVIDNLLFGGEESNDSSQNTALRFMVDQATDLVVGEAIERAISTSESDLSAEVNAMVSGRLASLVSSSPASDQWVGVLHQIVEAHRCLMAERIIEALQVDRDWAIGALNEYCNQFSPEEVSE